MINAIVLMAVIMFSTRRYLALGTAFVALTGATVIHTAPRIEADVYRQAFAAVDNVQHMVVSVDGRNLTLRGLMRTTSPQQITPAVQDLINALDRLPAVDQLDASVNLLSVERDVTNQAARAATIKRT
ncbi:MAG: hypothetical protein AB8B96_04670 [Lysobacterales bacterium]